MKRPRKPVRQCYNCIDYDPGLLGWIFDFFARYGYCLHNQKKVRAEYVCTAFKLSPHFWDRDTQELVSEDYGKNHKHD